MSYNAGRMECAGVSYSIRRGDVYGCWGVFDGERCVLSGLPYECASKFLDVLVELGLKLRNAEVALLQKDVHVSWLVEQNRELRDNAEGSLSETLRLRDENVRLHDVAQQSTDHVERLLAASEKISSENARLRSENHRLCASGADDGRGYTLEGEPGGTWAVVNPDGFYMVRGTTEEWSRKLCSAFNYMHNSIMTPGFHEEVLRAEVKRLKKSCRKWKRRAKAACLASAVCEVLGEASGEDGEVE